MTQAALKAIGGLALFLFGMGLLTSGLREWAGVRLQDLLRRATARRGRALMAGVGLGAFLQTSAGTLLTAGLVHAGLISLAASLPLIFGMNIGTTLAVQVITFRVADFAAIPLAIGTVMYLTARPARRSLGLALIGFGLLFIGMNMMSEPIRPWREPLGRWLMRFDGRTVQGLLLGTAASLIVTAVLQSSSAVIGIAIALASAGAITRFEQAYPILIGANIGTCVTALIGTLGSRPAARRAAYAHLLFNVFGGGVGVVAAPVFYRYIGLTSDTLTRQIAHANTIKMVLTVIAVWPWQSILTSALYRLIPVRNTDAEAGTALDDALLNRPENALRAVTTELQRAVQVCWQSHRLTRQIMLENTPDALRRVARNEETSDRLKQAVRVYLTCLTRRYLSRRQAILLQYLDRIAWNIERIHDHITVIVELSVRRYHVPEATVFIEDLDRLFDLHEHIEDLLALLEQSLDPSHLDFYPDAQKVLASAHAFSARLAESQLAFTDKIARHQYPSVSGLFYSEYLFTFDRIAQHICRIAQTECEPDFRFKASKFDREAPPAPPFEPPERVRVAEYLAKRGDRRAFPPASAPPTEETVQ